MMDKTRKEKLKAKQQRRRDNITTGVILILLGALFLLNTLNILTFNMVRLIFSAWPLLLILLGLNLLFKRSKLWWITPALLIILFVTLIYPGYFSHYHQVFFRDQQTEEVSSVEKHLELTRPYSADIKGLDLDLRINAGRIDIAASEDKEKLYDLLFHYQKEEEEPEVEYYFEEEAARAFLDVNQMREFALDSLDIVNASNLKLNPEVDYNINIDSGAGYYYLDFRELKVSNLNMNSGISDVQIYFAKHDTDVRLNSGASNIKLFFPAEVGIRIEIDGAVAAEDFKDAGLTLEENDVFVSENYQEEDENIRLEIISPASNINIDFID